MVLLMSEEAILAMKQRNPEDLYCPPNIGFRV